MKAKVKYRKYGNIPNMNTVKDIIVYGAKQGKQKKQYAFKDKAGNYCEKSFDEVFYDATGLGQHLYSLGLRGKKVAILSENSYYWIAAFYSIASGHMIAIPLDPKLPNKDLVDLMVRSGCDAIYYSNDFAPAIKMMQENPDVKISIYLKIEDFDELVKKVTTSLTAAQKTTSAMMLSPTISDSSFTPRVQRARARALCSRRGMLPPTPSPPAEQ